MTLPEHTTQDLMAQCELHFSADFDRDNAISGGSTAFVERLPCGHVRKIPFPDASIRGRASSLQNIATEHEVYGRIKSLPHFLEMIEISAERGIVLQAMPGGTLRQHLEIHGPSVSLFQRLKWAYDIAGALDALESESTVQTDLFAMGSTLYEIFTGTQPYPNLPNETGEEFF